MEINSEDMVQVLNQTKQDVFRDMRVCSPCCVTEVYFPYVSVQLLVSDVSGGVQVNPPVVKNVRVVGSASLIGDGMPDVGAMGVMLHFDRKNAFPSSREFVKSGGPSHDVNFGVFLPIVMTDDEKTDGN